MKNKFFRWTSSYERPESDYHVFCGYVTSLFAEKCESLCVNDLKETGIKELSILLGLKQSFLHDHLFYFKKVSWGNKKFSKGRFLFFFNFLFFILFYLFGFKVDMQIPLLRIFLPENYFLFLLEENSFFVEKVQPFLLCLKL